MGKIQRITYKGQELLPAKADVVFKALLTADGDFELLASLLSCLLELDIVEQGMVVTNTEIAPLHEGGKLSRIDVRAELADGRQVNVEIQLKNEHNIEKRSIYYTSRLYAAQMRSGVDFSGICATIAINILDFTYLPFEEYHNRYRLKNVRNNHELTDVFEINFIELKKVPKGAHNRSLKELWMLFLAAEKGGELEMIAKENPIMEKAVNKLCYVSADKQLRYELDMREKAELDYGSAMITNYRKGVEEGRAMGVEEGRAMGVEEGRAIWVEEERTRTAIELKKEGMDDVTIAKVTNLPIDIISQISKT